MRIRVYFTQLSAAGAANDGLLMNGRPIVAVTSSGPDVPAGDEISLAAASVLFAETGHPASVRTLKRWCQRHGTPVIRQGRADYASWSALLTAHAAEVDARSTRG